MEQTLGNRISARRKQKKMTQDQLAEQLGVTAQAVSKWENDQSCPDISMLPRLATIFGCSTDELLGIETATTVHHAEVITDDDAKKEDGLHITRGGFEFKLENGDRKGAIGFAVLVLTVGGLTLANHLLSWGASFWSILWPTTILVFGLFGSIPSFSFGSLGCAAFGAYFLLDNLNILPFEMGWSLALPIALLFFGISLLIKAIRKPKRVRPIITVNRNGADSLNTNYSVDEETFSYSASFGSSKHYVEMPRLSYGSVNSSFCETTIDLSGVEEITEACAVDVNLSFGECTVLVPRRYSVDLDKNASFASVVLKGEPAQTTDGTIVVTANATFGQVTIWYI